jgi:hypothetical protein
MDRITRSGDAAEQTGGYHQQRFCSAPFLKDGP